MHPILRPEIVAAIDGAVSAHLGRRWNGETFVDFDDRASHPCGIWRGPGFDVFIKYSADVDGAEQFTLECRGLEFLREHARVRVAQLVGDGALPVDGGWLLLLEAPAEIAPSDRTTRDWRSIGHTLATLHAVTGTVFGLDGLDGYFGPLKQDNRPVVANRWADFVRERRLMPYLHMAIRSGNLPDELVPKVRAIGDCLADLIGPEPVPTLLHGDAQQNNFLSTEAGAVIIDASPFYGHPENDLAMLDIFAPIPADVFDAYRELRPIDDGFERRRELWRIPVYLAAIAVDGANPFGRSFIPRLAGALAGR